jgi:hypothetical protein
MHKIPQNVTGRMVKGYRKGYQKLFDGVNFRFLGNPCYGSFHNTAEAVSKPIIKMMLTHEKK